MWKKALFFLVENDPYFIFSIILLKFICYWTYRLEILPQMSFCHFTIPKYGCILAKTGLMIPGQTVELGCLTQACSWGWAFSAAVQDSCFNVCRVLFHRCPVSWVRGWRGGAVLTFQRHWGVSPEIGQGLGNSVSPYVGHLEIFQTSV